MANLIGECYERAIELSTRSLRENSLHTPTLRTLAAALDVSGRPEEAREAMGRLRQLEPALTATRLARTLSGARQSASRAFHRRTGGRRVARVAARGADRDAGGNREECRHLGERRDFPEETRAPESRSAPAPPRPTRSSARRRAWRMAWLSAMSATQPISTPCQSTCQSKLERRARAKAARGPTRGTRAPRPAPNTAKRSPHPESRRRPRLRSWST